jgi:hypothetical protein
LIVLLLAGVCLARLGELLLPARAARVILALLLLLQVAIGIVHPRRAGSSRRNGRVAGCHIKCQSAPCASRRCT